MMLFFDGCLVLMGMFSIETLVVVLQNCFTIFDEM